MKLSYIPIPTSNLILSLKKKELLENVSSTNTVRVELKVQSNRMRIPIPLDRVFEGRDQDFERALTQLLVPGARVCMAV